MDNIKLITILSDYAIFCLERQRNVLAAYRKIRRERWDFVGIILGIIVCAAAIMASIWCAVADIICLDDYIVINTDTQHLHYLGPGQQYLREACAFTRTLMLVEKLSAIKEEHDGQH